MNVVPALRPATELVMRVRQTFTNKLTEPIVVWVEMECHCWILQPQERLTVEYDAQGCTDHSEPLPVELSTDGKGDDRMMMLVLWNDGRTEASFFVNDEALVVGGELTELGRSRFVSELPKAN